MVTQSANLSQVFADAESASTAAFALPATQTFGTGISNATTINGNGGTNVMDVAGINLTNGALTLNGSASDVFIVNVTGDLTSSNSNIAISGGVTPNNVLINVSGSVTITGGGPNNFYGTILDPNWPVNVHDKLLTGELIGNTITDTSGFSVNYDFPRVSPELRETGTVTVSNTNLVASYVSNYRNPSANTPSITTNAMPTSGTVEVTTLNDSAILSGGTNPTGTITFTLTAPNGSTAATETVSVNGDSTYSTPTGVLATQVGTYYWVASYSGDSNNLGVSSGTKSEPVTVTSVSPTINTSQQPASASVGTSIADKATVSGGDNPTGTVTFTLYNNPNGSGTPLFSDTETLSGGMATSKGYTATATGTDYWVATYNGDSNNASVTSGTASEPVTVTSVGPTINTSQQPASASVGMSIADKATVSGGDNPTGTVTFTLYNNPNGSGTPLFSDTETLSGGMATSKGYTATATGTDYWVATYNGDSNNASVTSGTASEPVTIVPPATPAISLVKLTNGVNDPNPNGSNVPQLGQAHPVTWTYLVTNTGNVPFARASVVVTDNQPGVTPAPKLNGSGFVVGDTNDNNILDPGETWTYTVTGTALNLSNPPAGVTTVPIGTDYIDTTLGAADNYAALVLPSTRIQLSSGPLNITGNVGVGNSGELDFSAGTVNGRIDLGTGATNNISGGATATGGVNKSRHDAGDECRPGSFEYLRRSDCDPDDQRQHHLLHDVHRLGRPERNRCERPRPPVRRALTLIGGANDQFIFNITQWLPVGRRRQHRALRHQPQPGGVQFPWGERDSSPDQRKGRHRWHLPGPQRSHSGERRGP